MIAGCTNASASVSNELVATSGCTSEHHSQTTCARPDGTPARDLRESPQHKKEEAREKGSRVAHVKAIDELLAPDGGNDVIILLEPGRDLLFLRHAQSGVPRAAAGCRLL